MVYSLGFSLLEGGEIRYRQGRDAQWARPRGHTKTGDAVDSVPKILGNILFRRNLL